MFLSEVNEMAVTYRMTNGGPLQWQSRSHTS